MCRGNHKESNTTREYLPAKITRRKHLAHSPTVQPFCVIETCVIFTLIEKLKAREERRPGLKKTALGLRNK